MDFHRNPSTNSPSSSTSSTSSSTVLQPPPSTVTDNDPMHSWWESVSKQVPASFPSPLSSLPMESPSLPWPIPTVPFSLSSHLPPLTPYFPPPFLLLPPSPAPAPTVSVNDSTRLSNPPIPISAFSSSLSYLFFLASFFPVSIQRILLLCRSSLDSKLFSSPFTLPKRNPVPENIFSFKLPTSHNPRFTTLLVTSPLTTDLDNPSAFYHLHSSHI